MKQGGKVLLDPLITLLLGASVLMACVTWKRCTQCTYCSRMGCVQWSWPKSSVAGTLPQTSNKAGLKRTRLANIARDTSVIVCMPFFLLPQGLHCGARINTRRKGSPSQPMRMRYASKMCVPPDSSANAKLSVKRSNVLPSCRGSNNVESSSGKLKLIHVDDAAHNTTSRDGHYSSASPTTQNIVCPYVVVMIAWWLLMLRKHLLQPLSSQIGSKQISNRTSVAPCINSHSCVW